MKKGLSLHLGLNYVDPDQYEGWDGELYACEADAKDMTALAKSRGFKTKTLLREKVTAKAVKNGLLQAAKTLKSGDIFFLTYSGHGGQVPDTNGDEGQFGDTSDRKDETWCLYDRELVDDELAALYARFKRGVRIVVLSDSCHSGSVTRAGDNRAPSGRARLLPPRQAEDVYIAHKALYDAVQEGVTGAEQQEIKATVLLISGCQDRQLSNDGDNNGLFTGTLKEIWDDGAFLGNYKHFRDQIAARMPHDQIPNYFVIGTPNKTFENEGPFTIAKRRTQSPRNSATARRRDTSAKTRRSGGKEGVTDYLRAKLKEMGLAPVTPKEKLAKFFQACEKADEKLGLDFTRSDAFCREWNKRFPGATLTKNDLLKGRFATVEALVGRVG